MFIQMKITIVAILLLAMNCQGQPSVGANAAPVQVEFVVIGGYTNFLSGVSQTITIPPSISIVDIYYISDKSASNGVPAYDHFRHILRGREMDWVDVGNTHFARYTKLEPGRYVFEVQVADPSGAWLQSGSTLTITVPSAVTPFRLAVLGMLFLLSVSTVFYLIRTKQTANHRA